MKFLGTRSFCLLFLFFVFFLFSAPQSTAFFSRKKEKGKDGVEPGAKKASKGTIPPGACISQGGRFPPFVTEGKKPAKAPAGRQDLSLCVVYRQRTCCNHVQTDAALISLRKMATSGEGNEECLGLWEVMECSACNPSIGVLPGPPLLCQDFCDRVYESCRGAYFVADTVTQVLNACGPRDAVCARGHEWGRNGTEFCQMLGFQVGHERGSGDGDEEEQEGLEGPDGARRCFSGTPSREDIAKTSTASSNTRETIRIKKKRRSSSTKTSEEKKKKKKPRDTANGEVTEDAKWMVGGLLLAASIALLRWYSWRSRRKRALLAVPGKASRSMQEVRTRQQEAVTSLSKRSRTAKSVDYVSNPM